MLKRTRTIVLAAALALGVTLGGAAQAEAGTHYQSGRCWPSGANSSASLVASSWWYDAPLWGKQYHVGATSATVSGISYSIKSIYIPNYGYATNTRDFIVGFGTHADGYVVATWARANVDSGMSNVTCRVYL